MPQPNAIIDSAIIQKHEQLLNSARIYVMNVAKMNKISVM